MSVKERAPQSPKPWDDSTVMRAIDDQARGRWNESAQLAATMLTDGRYGACLNTRVLGLARLTPTFEPDNADDPKEAAAAKLLTDTWHLVIPETVMAGFIEQYLQVSISPAFLSWSYDTDVNNPLDGGFVWLPRLDLLNAQGITWEWNADKFTFLSRDGIKEVTPGKDNWVMANSWRPGIPRGFVSQLGMVWLDKQLNRFTRREVGQQIAHPTFKAITPMGNREPDNFGGGDNNPTVEQRSAFVNSVLTAARNGDQVIECPQDKGDGYDLIPLQVSRDGAELCENAIRGADTDYSITILGANLGTEVTTVGARSAVETHIGVQRVLIDSDASALSTVLTEQVWRPYIKSNFGPGVKCPTMKWRVPSDLETEAQIKDETAAVEKKVSDGA